MNIKGTNTGPWSKVSSLPYESFEATGKCFTLPAEPNAFKIKGGKLILKAVDNVAGAGIHGIFVQVIIFIIFFKIYIYTYLNFLKMIIILYFVYVK